MEYKIIIATSIKDLEMAINKALKNRWHLQGGISHQVIDVSIGSVDSIFMQAVTKPDIRE